MDFVLYIYLATHGPVAENRKRAIIEHAIGRLKMGSVFRNKLGRHDDMTSIVSGLVK